MGKKYRNEAGRVEVDARGGALAACLLVCSEGQRRTAHRSFRHLARGYGLGGEAMTTITFYKCCEHCCDECRYDDHHETACGDVIYDPDNKMYAKACDKGCERVEVVTP
jgi:hypothetical protein